jgi:mono/diheme cytochrome c family protein
MAPDGALYISDDVHGRIWRVTAQNADALLAAAPAPAVANASLDNPGPPEGQHADAGRPGAASLPVPPGSSREQVALGDRIYHGEASAGTCAGCHGSDAKGSPQAPSLVNGNWFFADGSLQGIAKTIADGVPRPRNYSDPMPPKGGAPLSDSDVGAVAAYVWAMSHPGGR